MSDNRKYYYLKLKENYFDEDAIVLLESMQDGILYSNILLKLYLKSLKNGGKLQLDENIPYTAQMIATITRQQMGAKLERLGAELAKARKKKAEWDSRVKDLERRYREEENSEIHEMVHAANLTPDQLSELLKMFAEDSAPKPETIQSVTEEETTHEN